MTLKLEDVRAYALAQLGTYDLAVDHDVAIRSIEQDILEDWGELNSLEVRESRFEHFKIKGTSATDFFERELILTNQKKVIYGIRHFGGNREKPFINILPNFTFQSKEDVFKIASKLKEELSVFTPELVCFWHKDTKLAEDVGAVVVTGKYISFSSSQPWPNEKDIDFELISNEDYYPWYESLYQDFHQERADLKDLVTINSKETMNESMEQKLLFYVLYNKKKVGIIAAIREELLGHEGFYFNEVLLCSDFKGIGLGKAIKRKFVLENAKKDDYIWGTIDYSNQPSYRASLRNQRVPIRYECFIGI